MPEVKVLSSVNIENKELVETKPDDTEKISVKFAKPYVFEGESVSELDLTGMNDLKGLDLQTLYKKFVQKTGLHISNPGLTVCLRGSEPCKRKTDRILLSDSD